MLPKGSVSEESHREYVVKGAQELARGDRKNRLFCGRDVNFLSPTQAERSQFVRTEREPCFYAWQHIKIAHKRFVRACGGLHEAHGNIVAAPTLPVGVFCLQKY